MKDLESMDALEPRVMLAIAEAALDEVGGLFAQQVGADPVIMKLRRDFATETDLEIERHLRQPLTQYSGLPIYGEEFGGKVPEEHTAWVIDPIDGTTNYSSGFPLCAMLLTLMREGEPVVGITSIPLLRRHITAARGGDTFVNGHRVNIDTEADRLVSIAFGSVVTSTDGTLPRKWRQLLLSKVSERYPTIRIIGSVGADLGSTAMGAFDDTVTFSPYVWDNAAGALQISEAGGVVTDLAGNSWWHDSVGALTGTRDAHATLRSIINQLGRPETFRSQNVGDAPSWVVAQIVESRL